MRIIPATTNFSLCVCLLVLCLCQENASLQLPGPLRNLLQKKTSTTGNNAETTTNPFLAIQKYPVEEKKARLLAAVSLTQNGKTATVERQSEVLRLVDELEMNCPVGPNLFEDEALKAALDGVWYLQYTSPSIIEEGASKDPTTKNDNEDNNEEANTAWEAKFAKEGVNIPTTQFQEKGAISAAGITVDTSNRVTKQIFNVENLSVMNDVELDFGRVTVGGSFRQSSNVPNRAVVAFNTAEIMLNNGLTINLSFLFALIGVLRGTKDLGWIETTFLDKDVRVGRGNKGTMFVLTRDPDAVQA